MAQITKESEPVRLVSLTQVLKRDVVSLDATDPLNIIINYTIPVLFMEVYAVGLVSATSTHYETLELDVRGFPQEIQEGLFGVGVPMVSAFEYYYENTATYRATLEAALDALRPKPIPVEDIPAPETEGE